jgi:hypothetical protein
MEDPGAADDLPGLAEDGDRNALVVDIETEVKYVPPEVDVPRNRRHGVPGYPTDRGFLHSLNTEADWS